MRDRMNVYFPPEILKQISELADRKKLSRSAIVEAAVASFLSPDGADRREAAFTRRLDRLSRQMQRLERDVGLTAESLALFIRFWLTIPRHRYPTTRRQPHRQRAGSALKDLSRRSVGVCKRGKAFCAKFQKIYAVRNRPKKSD
ncbi:DNA-binding transcriptional MocR family regulator [Bradyrhizobium embrapense]